MLSYCVANHYFSSSNRRAQESEHKQVAFASIAHHKLLVEGDVVSFPGPPAPSLLLHELHRASSPPDYGRRGCLEQSVRSVLFHRYKKLTNKGKNHAA